ncbi:MAG: NusG domain II-containing protein [bacterium]|nr:NusG domain II-containing protein [Spirochaetales bacterium]MDT3389131.1 NusG domain II-containing protein [bacterium]
MKRSRMIRDIILIAVILAVAVVLLIVTGSHGTEGSYVSVMLQNDEIARYSLSNDGIYAINGGTNTIEIKDGKVRMIEAQCPNHLCVHQGWIGLEGQSIVCLPNKVTVSVCGTGDGPDFIL